MDPDEFFQTKKQKFSLPLKLRQHTTLAMVMAAMVNAPGYLHPLLSVLPWKSKGALTKGHQKPSFGGW